MARAFLIVMDSVGIGGAKDADRFFNDNIPDTGANTVLHIAQACADNLCNDGRKGPLKVPYLDKLGLGAALCHATQETVMGCEAVPTGAFGVGHEISKGKDTPSGHWELTGVPVPWRWHFFPKEIPTFDKVLTDKICALVQTDGVLGNCHASGTAIIEKEGERHIETGWPICYTSSDSVVQIAAHEEHFGLERLYALCEAIAPYVHDMKVGRVIARPFVGECAKSFTRTKNRKDYAIAPPSPTLCDYVYKAGRKVYSVGKIGDIFSMRGISDSFTGKDKDLMSHLQGLVETAEDGSFIFANFVEFDSEFGHRRNVCGYAKHLEWFDRELRKILQKAQPDDLIIVTADHGNDPTWHGTDHTRECVPILVHGIGTRALGDLSFCDVGASIADHLDVPYFAKGKSFL